MLVALVTHLTKRVSWMRVEDIVDVADVFIIVGAAKVITPLRKGDVLVSVHEAEGDPLIFSWL
jgi:hypothetical protein